MLHEPSLFPHPAADLRLRVLQSEDGDYLVIAEEHDPVAALNPVARDTYAGLTASEALDVVTAVAMTRLAPEA